MQTLARDCPEKDENGKCRKQGIPCYVEWYPDCKIYQESLDGYKIKCSNCGEDLTPLLSKRMGPVVDGLVKMSVSSPEIKGIQIKKSTMSIKCPKCETRDVYLVDINRLGEIDLERFK